MFKLKMLTSAVIAATVGLSAVAVSADEVSDFYKGKRLKIIIGSGPGGGYDTYARLVERHMRRHIPGNPSIISQNMTGAGGIIATNFVVNVAPKNGTIIGGLQRSAALVPLLVPRVLIQS